MKNLVAPLFAEYFSELGTIAKSQVNHFLLTNQLISPVLTNGLPPFFKVFLERGRKFLRLLVGDTKLFLNVFTHPVADLFTAFFFFIVILCEESHAAGQQKG